jgi:hypothetical protein
MKKLEEYISENMNLNCLCNKIMFVQENNKKICNNTLENVAIKDIIIVTTAVMPITIRITSML